MLPFPHSLSLTVPPPHGPRQLTRKILHGEFALPAHLSHEASDLLARILVVDPSKRATVAAIRQHPWMQHGYMPVEPHVLDVHDALQVRRIQGFH